MLIQNNTAGNRMVQLNHGYPGMSEEIRQMAKFHLRLMELRFKLKDPQGVLEVKLICDKNCQIGRSNFNIICKTKPNRWIIISQS